MTDVICLGEIIVDMIATDRDAGLAGSKGFLKFPGGATANVSVGVSRLGGRSAFLGTLADDPFGAFLKDALSAEGVDAGGMKLRKGERTVVGFLAVKSDQTKEAAFYRDFESEMFLNAEELDPDFIARGRIFHCGIICLRSETKRRCTHRGIRIAKDKGLMVSMDLNYRPHAWPSRELARERLEELLPALDVLKIADEEWPLLFDGELTAENLRAMMPENMKAVILSRGAAGATVVTKDMEICAPAFQVEAVETTGAGDSFTAATLLQLSRKMQDGLTPDKIEAGEWKRILRRANASGALACLKPGAIPALPTKERVDEFLKANSS